MSDQRLDELETRLAFQDQLVEELNKQVFEQDKRLQKLEATCKSLSKQLLDLTEDAPAAEIDDQPPPHY